MTTIDRAGRRDFLGRAEPRQPDRRHPAVGGDPRRVSAQRCPRRSGGASARRRRADAATSSSSSNRSSAWTAISRRSPSTRRSAGRPARRSSWTRRTRSASTARRGSGLDRGSRHRRRRLRVDQHGGQGARRQRRVRRRPRLGDRLSDPAGAAVRLFDGAAAGAGRRARRQPRRRSATNPSGGSGWPRACAGVRDRLARAGIAGIRPTGRRSFRSRSATTIGRSRSRARCRRTGSTSARFGRRPCRRARRGFASR